MRAFFISQWDWWASLLAKMLAQWGFALFMSAKLSSVFKEIKLAEETQFLESAAVTVLKLMNFLFMITQPLYIYIFVDKAILKRIATTCKKLLHHLHEPALTGDQWPMNTHLWLSCVPRKLDMVSSRFCLRSAMFFTVRIRLVSGSSPGGQRG